MVAEATSDRPKMSKAVSSEEEVARLTIEVRREYPHNPRGHWTVTL